MKFTSYEKSVDNLIKSIIKSTKKEKLFLMDSLNRVLANDIIALFNSPNYPTSAMDGYAIKWEDQKLKKIKIIDSIPAGEDKKQIIKNGECIKTFTGSLMSDGSDTLIPIENVTLKDDYILINKEVKKGFSVRNVGENFKKGEILIKQGTLISYPQIGVMASLNLSQVEVFQKPKVTIIATGNEIIDVGDTVSNAAQIVSSNHLTLEALAKIQGAIIYRSSLVRDNKEKIKEQILESLESSDIVVTTGGVSVGDYDFVKEIIKEFEPIYLIDGVNIKPGQHIKVVKIGKKYIFALPGFPYSSTVTFILYVIPVIKAMQGLNPNIKTIKAKLKESYKKKSNKDEFAACNIRIENGEFVVDFKNKKSGSSAILTNMLGEIGLIHLKSTDSDKEIGETVDILFFLL